MEQRIRKVMSPHKPAALGVAAVSACLVTLLSSGVALGYFTSQAKAVGSVPVRLGARITVDETFDNWTKHLTVTLDQDAQPSYVRARAFCGKDLLLSYGDAAGAWRFAADGFWYYEALLMPGEQTSVLDIAIDNIPSQAQEGDDFHVIVVYEYVPACYDSAGNPYADWNSSTVSRLSEREG